MEKEEFLLIEDKSVEKNEDKNYALKNTLAESLDKIIQDEHKLFGIEKEILEMECNQLSVPFLKLFGCYFKCQGDENYGTHLDDFLKQYNSFLDEFYYRVAGTERDQQIYFVIAYFWLQTLKQLEKNAGDSGDRLSRSIYIQLQADITFIVHKIYKTN